MKKIALLSLLVFLVGCHGDSALEMPRIPLPHGYVDELTAMRKMSKTTICFRGADK